MEDELYIDQGEGDVDEEYESEGFQDPELAKAPPRQKSAKGRKRPAPAPMPGSPSTPKRAKAPESANAVNSRANNSELAAPNVAVAGVAGVPDEQPAQPQRPHEQSAHEPPPDDSSADAALTVAPPPARPGPAQTIRRWEITQRKALASHGTPAYSPGGTLVHFRQRPALLFTVTWPAPAEPAPTENES